MGQLPNMTAYVVLALWPLACFVLFRTLSVERAVIWSILGGYLLLPPLTDYDFALMPPWDKVLIPNIVAYLLCVLVLRERVPLVPKSWIAAILAMVFVLSSIPTVLANGDPVVFRIGALPGLRLQDIVSATGTQVILLMPLAMGRRFLASPHGLRELLLAMFLGGLAYTLPALFEIRMSPVLNRWIYGFFQHDFSQAIRYGGFRPFVFLPHAIWLAVFLMMATAAGAELMKGAPRDKRMRNILILLYMLGVLVLCKVVSAMVYALLAVPLVLFASPQVRLRVALALTLIALVYPALQSNDLVPVDDIIGRIAQYDADRAHSLNVRFENEREMLALASERPVFGWGGWGRSFLHDPDTGRIQSIADGRWIIVFGTYGWVGFLAEFGLLAMPVLLLFACARLYGIGSVSPHAATLGLLLSINMFDLLPNATLEPITWLIAGAVLGHAERVMERERRARAAIRPVRRTII